jgi:hypothetical protein
MPVEITHDNKYTGPTEYQSKVPLKNQDYFDRKVDSIRQDHVESVAKWKKDHPNREPGTSTRTWKSFSQMRFSSPAYRRNFDTIDWGN